jgi:hypothetical protein
VLKDLERFLTVFRHGQAAFGLTRARASSDRVRKESLAEVEREYAARKKAFRKGPDWRASRTCDFQMSGNPTNQELDRGRHAVRLVMSGFVDRFPKAFLHSH